MRHLGGRWLTHASNGTGMAGREPTSPGRGPCEKDEEPKMSRDGRKLTKQPIPEGVTEGVSAPPPMETVPDMAETLRLLEKISRMPDIRFEKVQRMRELIAQDRFETPERIDGTVARLREELGL